MILPFSLQTEFTPRFPNEATLHVEFPLEKYNPTFTASNVERASHDSGAALDALPFGVIVTDRTGTIVEYNRYEHQLAGHVPDVIGKNFFKDVAPWAAVTEFEGRWEQFISSRESTMVPFDFTLPGPSGPEQVTVMFVRVKIDDDHATICIARKGDQERT